MPNLETYANLFISKKIQKEALEIAALYENPKNFTLSFTESDFNDNSHENLIGKIKLLAEGGFIKWKVNECPKDENDEMYYQVEKMTLTVEGEKLLRSYSIFSKIGPILIGAFSGFLATLFAIKLGLL